MKLRTLLITGGHPTPALAVIDEIREHFPLLQVLFVGRRYVNAREKADSFEYQEVSARNVRFFHSAAARGNRGMVELPYRTLECTTLLKKHKPEAILSFGGYISAPVCLAAYVLKIPFFLHEQTIRPGTANIHLARLATKVMVSFYQTARYFEKDKVIVTGNPIRKNIVQNVATPKFSHFLHPTILVLGGNLGSHSINTHIFALLPQLAQKYSVIHQVGNIQQFGDWERAQEALLSLPDALKKRYFPVHHLTTDEMSEAYRRADMVISRSGASTITELIALKKPAVLVPLPWSAHGEQLAHAELLFQGGVAELFHQDRPSSQLLSCIQKIMNNVQSYTTHYDQFTSIYDPQAAQKILQTIFDSTN